MGRFPMHLGVLALGHWLSVPISQLSQLSGSHGIALAARKSQNFEKFLTD